MINDFLNWMYQADKWNDLVVYLIIFAVIGFLVTKLVK